MPTIFPTVTYEDPQAALAFLCDALGFTRHAVHTDGETIAHAEVRLGDAFVMLGAKRGEFATGRTVVYVALDAAADVDAVFDRAQAARATVVRAPFDTDYGSRDCAVGDPEGNVWSFGTYRPEPSGA